ncbi:MAG: hypothetical protein AAF438_09390 [Pseudomonadota bacterium]
MNNKTKRLIALLAVAGISFGLAACAKKDTDDEGSVVIVPAPDFGECKPQRCEVTGTNHEVRITERGSEPAIVEACPGDTITWRAQEQGVNTTPFLLYFKENGTRPCINCAVRAQPNAQDTSAAQQQDVALEQVLVHKIRTDAPAGCYDYEYVLLGRRTVFDPRIIIGN